LIRLAVRCAPELAERVLAELVELAPGGVEEEEGRDYVEFAIYGAPGELPALPELEAVAGDGTVEIATTEIPDDWADRWRDFHEPVSVAGGRLVVRPSWEEAAAPADVEIVVDPGQAFGTGAHPTTVMCLELLLERADAGEAGGPLADLGAGSGVLAIAAAKLGWDPVTGVDHEAAALDAAAANAAANGVVLELRRVNLRQEPPPPAGTVAANLTAPLLAEIAPRLHEDVRRVICSGLLGTEADDVERAFAATGLLRAERRDRGDWAALAFQRG
jgi:ribosomal protein L11 methyltransferase